MILDADLLLTDRPQSIPASTANATTTTPGANGASARVIDLGVGGDALGGNELTLYVIANKAGAKTAGSGDLTGQFKLQTSADNSNWSDLVISPSYDLTAINPGNTLFRCKLMDGFKRYLRIVALVSAGASTTSTSTDAATITAFLTKEQ